MLGVRIVVVDLALGALLLLAPAATRGEGELAPGPLRATRVAAPAAPFTESWAQMVRREALRGRPSPGALRAQAAAGVGPLGDPNGAPPAFTIFENFQGLSRLDALLGVLSPPWAPADAVGAAGPVQFVQLNNFQVGLFEKQIGARIGLVSLDGFFTIVQNGVVHPAGGAFSPQVIYDRLTARWYATALERASSPASQNHLLLAVSRTSDATGIFDKYLIPLGAPPGAVEVFNGRNALGLDSNGLYLGVNVQASVPPFSLAKLAVTPRASLTAANPQLGPVFLFERLADLQAPRTTFGIDPISPSTPVWVVGAPRGPRRPAQAPGRRAAAR